MARICTHSIFLPWVLLAVLMFAVGCGKESPAPRPPPPPPPFQPQTVVVDLGANGGKTTLVSTQGGGWTRNGEAFTSGNTVEGENGATYKLTFSDGRWMAEFVQPDPEMVRLGGSGDEVSVQKQEDGSYVFDGEPLMAGQVVDAGNGNQYRLTQGDDGTWTAEYVPPDPTLVMLGSSGQSVSLIRREDGSFTLDGTPLVSGEVRIAANENRYRFTQRADGGWIAEFIASPPVSVALGSSGDTVEVTLLEDRSYILDGEPLANGQTRTFESGSTYRFQLSADGTWGATFVEETVTVELGTRGGSIELTRLESGAYTRNGSIVENGQIVLGNGRQYRLTFGEGRWVAEYLQNEIQVRVPSEDVTITLLEGEDGQVMHSDTVVESGDEVTEGDSIFELRFENGRWTAEFVEERLTVELGSRGDFVTVVRLANGNFEYDGRRIRNQAVIRSPNTGIRYRLSLRDGNWTSRVYFPPTTGGGDPGDDGSAGVGGTPTTVEDLEAALPKDFLRNSADGSLNAQSALVQVKQDDAVDEQGRPVDYSGYRGSGAVEKETFVEAARKVLQSAVNSIKTLIDSDAESAARSVISAAYPRIREVLDGIFTNGGTTLLPRTLPSDPEDIDEDQLLDDFEDLLESLQDLESFRRELRAGGELGAFTSLQDDARDIFNANKGALAIGATENTRFGVIAEYADDATAQSIADDPTAAIATRAFAYSPLDASLMTKLPTRGEARYSGQTFAVESDGGDLFSGTISLRLWMGIERLEAEITNLTGTEDDTAWQHNGRSVTKIKLPLVGQAGLDIVGGVGGNFRFNATGDAEVSVGGSVFGIDVGGSALTGYFVGDTGEEVFGTWAIGDLLDGAFGANRQSISRVTLPSAPDSNGLSVEQNEILGLSYDAAAGTIQIPNAPAEFSDETNETDDVFRLSQLYSSGTVTRTETVGTGDAAVVHTLRVRLRRTSYTRFGVWTHTAPEATPRQGIFGYGNLGASTITGDDHPRNVVATYNGRTVAVSEGNIFDGNITVTVDWSDTGGRVESVIRQISPTLSIRGTQVRLIAFELDSFTGMSFSGQSGTKVEYVTGTDESTLSGQTHSGQFLGASLDGPVAVLGGWGFTSIDFSIQGKFGADLVPAP